MTKVGCLVILTICIISSSKIFSQSFPEFDSLKLKAYGALEKKDYSSSLNYFEKAIQLPENRKPENAIDLYYDIACAYSLAKKGEKALSYLERSFSVFKSKKGKTPVSALHLATDSDLDFIRSTARFSNLIERFYSKDKEILKYYNSQEIAYSDLLKFIKILSEEDNYQILIKDKIIYWEKDDGTYSYNPWVLPLPNYEGLKTKLVEFSNCSFNLNFAWSGNWEDVGQRFPFFGIGFYHCRFYGRCSLSELKFKNFVYFNKCEFSSSLVWFGSVDPENPNMAYSIDSCSLRSLFIYFSSTPGTIPIVFSAANNTVKDSSYVSLNFGNISKCNVSGNQFENADVRLSLTEVDLLQIKNNRLRNILIENSKIKSTFEFYRNKLSSKLIINNTNFPSDPSSSIDWTVLDNLHLALYKAGGNDFTFTKNGEYRLEKASLYSSISGENISEVSDPQDFDRLMGLYSMFLNLYKNKGNIESYNACFVQVKELQSKRLMYLYESNPSFEKYFRWKLSQLLRFYVRYGTDPARAVVISIYIIICFGIFFFFFPSDWDTTSKQKLMQNFKVFIQKNEKGYIKPFFVLSWGFIISLINAVTLSLNAFITLGFGNIPTHGIARYFCVLEGFLGWFLLSIFTVAMINQVL